MKVNDLKIRDGNALLEGSDLIHEMPSGSLEIVGEDGRSLFSLTLKDGQLQVIAGGRCKHGGVVLDDKLTIIPHSRNCVFIERPAFESK